ncbi:MAG: phosphoglycerate dehydrogenase [Dehalococcoidia bacterium]
MPKVLIADSIDPQGVDLLRSQAAQVDVKTGLQPAELKGILGGYDALIVRSQTRVTEELLEAGQQLQVIGRAGVGVDNIDLEAATRRGIAVVNAPTGNIVAAAEHTVALLLALARNIPQGHESLHRGQWQRSQFTGVEVRNKTLGVIGLGKVGSEVVRRLQGFNMRVIAHDPFISPDFARLLGVELVPLEKLLQEADFITVHTPLTEETRNLIGEERLRLVKPSVRIINVARGGLIDEGALLKALEEGRVAGAALDVFAQEPPGEHPLLQHPQVIGTPHLGASTQEAQREVAVEVAEQVLAVLRGEPARYIVNFPVLPPEVHKLVAPFVQVASLTGKLLTQLAEGQFLSLQISYQGEIAQYDTTILKAAVLMGLLQPVSAERVNLINAPVMAEQRGLKTAEQKESAVGEYASLLTATLKTSAGTLALGGTLMRSEVHIVRVNDYWLDMVPSVPYLLFIEHRDQPGMIGAVGTITGQNDINISFMEVGRLSPRGGAMMVLGLDDPMSDTALEQVRSLPHIDSAKVVKL